MNKTAAFFLKEKTGEEESDLEEMGECCNLHWALEKKVMRKTWLWTNEVFVRVRVRVRVVFIGVYSSSILFVNGMGKGDE